MKSMIRGIISQYHEHEKNNNHHTATLCDSIYINYESTLINGYVILFSHHLANAEYILLCPECI